MFNLSGSEIIFLLIIALVVLGPEKLPEAVRKFGKTYAELKKMTSGFQNELKSALDEPMREMRETADAIRKAANFDIDMSPTPTPASAQPTVRTDPAINPVNAAEQAEHAEHAEDVVPTTPVEPEATEPATEPTAEAPPE